MNHVEVNSTGSQERSHTGYG